MHPDGAFNQTLIAINEWNPLAILANSLKTYATGTDFNGREGSNLSATVALASLIPVGKTGNVTFKIGKQAFRYLDDLVTKTDLYHNFPISFDKHIIQNGAWSQRIKDGANWYELQGHINGAQGMFQIGVNQNGLIFHRNFVPF